MRFFVALYLTILFITSYGFVVQNAGFSRERRFAKSSKRATSCVKIRAESSSVEDEGWVGRALFRIVTQSVKKVSTTIQSPEVSKNKFVLKNLWLLENQPTGRRSLHLFDSAQFLDTYNKLSENIAEGRRIPIVIGPPGCGKTLTAATVFLTFAAIPESERLRHLHKDAEFVWINIRKNYYIMIKNGNAEMFYNKLPDISEKTMLVVYDAIETSTDRDSKKFQAVLKHVKSCLEQQVAGYTSQIVVTSEQAASIPTLVNAVTETPVEKISFRPWQLADYYEAIENDDFFAEVREFLCPNEEENVVSIERRKELIDEKYQVAGYCARFMFDLPADEVEAKISTAIQSVRNIQAILDVDTASVDAVKTIACKIDGRVMLVSTFAARELGTKKKIPIYDMQRFLEAAFVVREDITPALDGGIFELDFRNRIKLAELDKTAFQGRFRYYQGPLAHRSSSTSAESTTSSQIEVSKIVEFSSSSDVRIKGKGNLDTIHTWYIPKHYDQGGFDAVELVEDNKIRFYQLTRAKKHSLKVEYMVAFLHRFNDQRIRHKLPPIRSFDIAFVVPYLGPGELFPFKMPAHPELSHVRAFEYSVPLNLDKDILNAATYIRSGLNPSTL